MKEAEVKAIEAMDNLTITSVIRLANHGLDKEDEIKSLTKLDLKESQDTIKSLETE